MIFAGLVIDFQRLRVTNEIDSARLLAAFDLLDILNVFQFFLSLRSESQLTAQTAHGRHAGPDYGKKNP